MADSEQRLVLRDGIVMVRGLGYTHPDLASYAGEVVDVFCAPGQVKIRARGIDIELSPIQDLTVSSAKNTKRGALQAHLALVRDGHLLAAQKVFKLLRTGFVSLGLSDDCYEAERALERNGYRGLVLRSGCGIKFSILRKV